jgi:hypothetical protein
MARFCNDGTLALVEACPSDEIHLILVRLSRRVLLLERYIHPRASRRTKVGIRLEWFVSVAASVDLEFGSNSGRHVAASNGFKRSYRGSSVDVALPVRALSIARAMEPGTTGKSA